MRKPAAPATAGDALWERRAGRPITGEERRVIGANAAGFFDLLLQWDEARRDLANRDERAIVVVDVEARTDEA